MTANLRRLSLAQVSFSHHDSRLPSNSYSASLSQTMYCNVKTKTRCNPCWWLPSTISPPSTLLSTSSPLPSRLSTSRKGSLPNFQNKSLFSKLFVRFGFFRFIGVVSLAVLGTSVTYILLGRQHSTLYEQMTLFTLLLNLFIKDYITYSSASKNPSSKSASQVDVRGNGLLVTPLPLHGWPLWAALCSQGPDDSDP